MTEQTYEQIVLVERKRRVLVVEAQLTILTNWRCKWIQRQSLSPCFADDSPGVSRHLLEDAWVSVKHKNGLMITSPPKIA